MILSDMRPTMIQLIRVEPWNYSMAIRTTRFHLQVKFQFKLEQEAILEQTMQGAK